jgi:hypothetical protein
MWRIYDVPFLALLKANEEKGLGNERKMKVIEVRLVTSIARVKEE